MCLDQLKLEIALALIAKSGVREFDAEESDARQRLIAAVNEIANGLFTGDCMAASKQLITPMDGTPEQICFADHAGDFSPTAANDLRVSTPTTGQFAIASVANAAYRQSTKVDLGANWAPSYMVRAALEFAATPTAGNTVDFWWVPSSSGTAGTGNAAGASGADSAYTGYSSNAAAAIKQAIFIGSFICTAQATATVQIGEIGILAPPEEYGSLIMLNGSGAAIHSDDVECHVTFDPIVPESQ